MDEQIDFEANIISCREQLSIAFNGTDAERMPYLTNPVRQPKRSLIGIYRADSVRSSNAPLTTDLSMGLEFYC